MKKQTVMFLLASTVLSCAALLVSTTSAQPAVPPAQGQQGAPLAVAITSGDRDVIIPGKTYLNGRAGYNLNRGRGGGGGPGGAGMAPATAGPDATATWTKESGPGEVTFANAKAAQTSATFSQAGDYVLKLTADNGLTKASASINVTAMLPPPDTQLDAVNTSNFKIDSPLWTSRAKALIVGWIPHCVDEIEDSRNTTGGIDNFIEAGKKLAGQPAARHKGFPFSNAWVHQTVEAMSIALMVDPQGDKDIIAAQTRMKQTLDKWIPIILAAQEPDGYLQTRFTLNGGTHWDPRTRGEHEGYTAGYFLESAINHYNMTGHQDPRMYNAAKKLADCWADNIGPPSERNSKGQPKKVWFDGHQEMEQALVRFGRFVNDLEGKGKGQKYIDLAKFLLDSRQGGQEYDQSHLPVVQQYEAVGHAVRAAYTYSGMADVAVETHNTDYQSAVMSLWDNVVNKKWYLTGGIGEGIQGDASEGFGPNYALANNAYCESCSTCGEIFFQYKMNLAYQDGKYVDLYEDSIYNALLGAIDMKGTVFNYTNPLQGGNRTAWHNCPCCVGNIPRTLLMIPTWAYARSSDSIYVNLFIGSTVNIEDISGTRVRMIQKTDYPWSGKISISVNPEEAKNFTVKVRVPSHTASALYAATPEVKGVNSIAVNGVAIANPVIEKGYITIKRDWKIGDTIYMDLPMEVQREKASDKVAADTGRVALRYGPLIYSFEAVDQDLTKALPAAAKLSAVWKPDLFKAINDAPEGVMAITGAFADGTPMMAVPNYARLNRGTRGAAVNNTPAVPTVDGTPQPAQPPAGGRRGGGGASSMVWIREAQ